MKGLLDNVIGDDPLIDETLNAIIEAEENI